MQLAHGAKRPQCNRCLHGDVTVPANGLLPANHAPLILNRSADSTCQCNMLVESAVGEIAFDPSYYNGQELADLSAVWSRQSWNEADGYTAMQRFRSTRTLQKFVAVHASVHNPPRPPRLGSSTADPNLTAQPSLVAPLSWGIFWGIQFR